MTFQKKSGTLAEYLASTVCDSSIVYRNSFYRFFFIHRDGRINADLLNEVIYASTIHKTEIPLSSSIHLIYIKAF